MPKRRTAPKRRVAAKSRKPSGARKTSRTRGRTLPPAIERAPHIFQRLAAQYPDAHCALDFRNPYQLLVATILSAQCTDKRVNMVTPLLFAKYPDARALAAANPAELMDMIRSTGFFNNKTKNLLGMAAAVVEKHNGEIPGTMDELHALPGVGRKTANVVLGNAFGRDEGVVVDTHVGRLSQRLGLTKEADAVKIEQDLMTMFPRQQWTLLAHLLISHGRAVCDARRPLCDQCVIQTLCPSSTIKS